MTTDERMGRPSASGIERLSLCPGSWQLERTLPPLPETEDAASGTRIHAALAYSMAPSELTEDEHHVFNHCVNLEVEAIYQVFGHDGLQIDREIRRWFGDRISGKADFAAYHDSSRTLAILDFKTGRNEVVTADGNLQLRCLALIWEAYWRHVDRAVVGIIGPWQSEPISLCAYTREDLARAREWLVATLDAADKPDAPRIPSEKACRYCRAKAVCAEAQYASLLPALELRHQVGPALPKELVRRCSSRTLASFKDTARFALAVYEAADDEIKRRLDAGDEEMAKYYQLKPGAVREVIIDPQTVYERFIEKGGGSATFMPCVEVKKGRLKDQLKAVTGAKGKALDSELADVLAGCTEEKQNAPSLERVK